MIVILDKRSPKQVNVGELKHGATFLFGDNLYIVTNIKSGEQIDVFNVKAAESTYFSRTNTMVTPVDVIVEITNPVSN